MGDPFKQVTAFAGPTRRQRVPVMDAGQPIAGQADKDGAPEDPSRRGGQALHAGGVRRLPVDDPTSTSLPSGVTLANRVAVLKDS
jgi:hypothetical protein